MRPRSACRSAIVALPLAALLGCGGDGPTAVENQLSAELALDAFGALASVSGFAGSGLPLGAALRAEGYLGRAIEVLRAAEAEQDADALRLLSRLMKESV